MRLTIDLPDEEAVTLLRVAGDTPPEQCAALLLQASLAAKKIADPPEFVWFDIPVLYRGKVSVRVSKGVPADRRGLLAEKMALAAVYVEIDMDNPDPDVFRDYLAAANIDRDAGLGDLDHISLQGIDGSWKTVPPITSREGP